MSRTPSPPERPIIKHVARQVLTSGITKERIAKRTGWSEKKVSRLLTGQTELGAVEMTELARVLGKPIAKLFPPEHSRRAA